MPTYEYLCTACGHTFELFQSITAPVRTQCPQCGGLLERLMGKGAAVIFKGAGFYATEHRSEGYKKKAKEESGTGVAIAEPSKGGTSKSETKAEATSAKESPKKE